MRWYSSARGECSHPVEVEVLGMVQVGEPALHQRADEIQREGGALVAAQQKLRIGRARLAVNSGRLMMSPR